MREQPDIPDDLFVAQGKEIEAIFERLVCEALLRHKKLGNSIATWRDGEVVIIPPEEISIGNGGEQANGKQS